jgi:1-acyl-sn-glycerol-3-phosphate acyltransferase
MARSAFRSVALGFSLTEVLLRFCVLRWKHRDSLTLQQRAQWLHEACALILRRLAMLVSSSGSLPESGLIVSNHLSYLDILFYAAVMPCIFVSKSEVLSWPVFGLLARCGGTIFVRRDRAASVDEVSSRMHEALAAGIPIVLFPEGTSTDGSKVLPFYTALFEPAVQLGAPISSAAIAYTLDDAIEADLCYYGHITFFPHLLNTLGQKGINGRIQIEPGGTAFENRKIAARQTWERVVSARRTIAQTQTDTHSQTHAQPQ